LSVSDYAKNIVDFVGESLPEIGDKLLAINGQPISEYRLAIEPYHRYSTTKGFWWKLAAWIPQKNYQFPLPKWSLRFELRASSNMIEELRGAIILLTTHRHHFLLWYLVRLHISLQVPGMPWQAVDQSQSVLAHLN